MAVFLENYWVISILLECVNGVMFADSVGPFKYLVVQIW